MADRLEFRILLFAVKSWMMACPVDHTYRRV